MIRALGDTERMFYMDSILNSIKKMLGISGEYEHFDADIIMYINSVFVTLSQLGVSQADGFYISDDSATWDDFISDNRVVEIIKPYIYAKVRIIFDPPTSSIVMDAINRSVSEYEWRINTLVETKNN